MHRVWKTTLCCQIDSFHVQFLGASARGPGNCLVMDTGSVCSKSQQLLHFTLGEKGQPDLWGDWDVLIVLQAFDH